MKTAQKSVTLGLLKLTLNKLIDCHSSTGSPLLSTLQHHCSITAVPPRRAACMAQSSLVTWLLPENSTAQVKMFEHSPLPARCCQVRTGLHRNLQLFTSSASGIPALEIFITTKASS